MSRNGTQIGTRHSFTAMHLALLLDRASVFLTSFFSTSCVAAAILWLIYRAYQVLNKPLDELVGLLGFEIPQGPRIDLAAVKADGVTLHWKPAGDRRSNHKYEVQINGNVVAEIQQSDTSLIISNLLSDHNYLIRIVTINSLDFRASSDLLRIRTKALSSADFYQLSPAAAISDDQDAATIKTGPPVVRPFKSIPETSAGPAPPPPMARETSNGPGAIKRVPTGRKVSPAIYTNEIQQSSVEELGGSEETQQQLTQKLDEINRETAEAEKQIEEEEQELSLIHI